MHHNNDLDIDGTSLQNHPVMVWAKQLNNLVEKGDFKGAEQLYLHKQEVENLRPSVYVLNVLLKLYAKWKQPDKMMQTFNDLTEKFQYTPDILSYNTVLDGLGKTNSNFFRTIIQNFDSLFEYQRIIFERKFLSIHSKLKTLIFS